MNETIRITIDKAANGYICTALIPVNLDSNFIKETIRLSEGAYKGSIDFIAEFLEDKMTDKLTADGPVCPFCEESQVQDDLSFINHTHDCRWKTAISLVKSLSTYGRSLKIKTEDDDEVGSLYKLTVVAESYTKLLLEIDGIIRRLL